MRVGLTALFLNLFLAALFFYILYWVIRRAVAGGLADAERARRNRRAQERLMAWSETDPSEDE